MLLASHGLFADSFSLQNHLIVSLYDFLSSLSTIPYFFAHPGISPVTFRLSPDPLNTLAAFPADGIDSRQSMGGMSLRLINRVHTS